MAEKNFNDPRFRPSTLVELVQWRAATKENERVFTFLLDGNKKEVRLSFADLDRKARAFGAMLQQRGLQGERALLLYPPGLDYIIAFFGCLYAGVIAVPAYPPDPNRLNRTLPRLQAIVRDARATVALTNDTIMYMIRILKLGSRFSDSMEKLPFLRKFRTTMNFFTASKTGMADAQDLGDLLWISSDDVLDHMAEKWVDPNINSQTIAFLQYTSGSTGIPKGVILTHENLLANSADIYSAFGYSEGTEGVIWLPIYHDMGLIGGIIQPIYGGMPTTLLSPIHFLQRPLRWLEAISKIKSKQVVSGGPNFAYDLCVKKVTPKQLESLDLSNWSVAFSGAEPVRFETVERFYQTFKGNGFKKEAFLSCYGLAEATLYVTGVDCKQVPPYTHLNLKDLRKNKVTVVDKNHPDAQNMVSCGHTPPDQRVEIVNPQTHEKARPGETGEVWVQGPNVAQGYWQNEQATHETFQAYIKGSNEGPFLRTGDLGCFVDNNLYITGRVKDLIIIRGRNYYPQDIEFLVENEHPDIRPGCSAAFSIEEDSQEKLVIVAEVRQSKNLPLEEIISSIRQVVTETNDIRVHSIVLIKARTIAKTSSGKIQRHAVKNEYLEGKLKVIHTWQGGASISEASLVDDLEDEMATEAAAGETASAGRETAAPKTETAREIESWLINHLAETLGVQRAEIDIRKPFVSYGLDSAQAIGLVGDLEEYIDRPLSPTLIWDYPNIEDLSRYLQSEGSTQAVKLRRPKKGDANEPIAIVGYSLRMPKAKNAGEFWKNLADGVDCISEVPARRWDVDAFYDPNPGTPAKMITRWGGFVDDEDKFDPQFFGISPREAPHMDPQQRLLLEVSYEAFEHAGYTLEKISGSNTGVFVAISGADYLRLQVGNFDALDAYSGTGNAFSIAANRLSYVYNLKGSSFIMDTACSSSLVAVHNAVQSLRRGETDMGLAAGVNLVLAPDITITFSQARMMSPNGRCKTFDADADGYVRGDGVGVVILKRLSDALKDGDTIHALIRGSAINQDGRSNGITAPNGLAQQECIRLALEDAGVSPAEVSYFETHGTGTPLGDPIETEAMKAVMIDGRDESSPLIIGSVKTNIGHLESAAGISGLLKTILALEHKTIPRHLHFKKLNPHIKLENTHIAIATETMPWNHNKGPRIAGVSAYGFGGTNAHIVLQEAPDTLDTQLERDLSKTDRPFLLTLSAHSNSALEAMAARYAEALKDETFESAEAFWDFLYSAAAHRSHLDYSAALVAGSRTEMIEMLEGFGSENPAVIRSSSEANAANRLLFVYSGQGPQWYAMGRQLMEKEVVFRTALEQIDTFFSEYADWSIIEELKRDEETSRMGETEVAQPAIFAIQVALTRLWESWGIRPAAVVGHSVGEVAAAYVSGTLSLKDAVKVIYHRGKLMQRATGFGKMASVALPVEKVREAIRGFEDKSGIGAHNSPENTVLSGEPEALEKVIARLEAEGVYTKMLRVNYAFHSPHMEPFKQELVDLLQGIQVHKPIIPIYSTLTGKRSTETDYDPVYWSRNIREQVSFAGAMNEIIKEGYSLVLELAPHPVLGGAIRECYSKAKAGATVLFSLKRRENEQETLYRALGALYTRGLEVRWQKVYPAGVRFRALPAYPWQKERYWFDLKNDDPMTAPIFKRPQSGFSGGHPLIGTPLRDPLMQGKILYKTTLDVDRLPWLKGHKIQESVVFPATAYIEQAINAFPDKNGRAVTLKDFNIFKALFLSEDEQPVHLVYTPYTDHHGNIQIFSLSREAEMERWAMNAMGTLSAHAPQNDRSHSVEEIKKHCGNQLDAADLYARLSERGLQYTDAFRAISEIWNGNGQALGRIVIDREQAGSGSEYAIHPALLDASLQVLSATLMETLKDDDSTYMPVYIERFTLHASPADEVWAHARLTSEIDKDMRAIRGDITIFDNDGNPVAEVQGLKLQRLGQKEELDISDWYYKLDWEEAPLETANTDKLLEETPGSWLIYLDKHPLGQAIAGRLKNAGHEVFIARPSDDFTRIDEFIYGIRMDEKEDYRRVMEAMLTHSSLTPKGILFLTGLDMPANASLQPEDVLAREQSLLLSALYATQSLLEQTLKKRPRLAFITEKARVLENESHAVAVAQSSLWGFGRVVTSENPTLHCLKIDLDNAEHQADDVITQILADHREDQLALHGGKRYTARLDRAREMHMDTESAGTGLSLPDGNYRLKIETPGSLSALTYETVARTSPQAGQVEVEVVAAGLNFRDVLEALGLYPGGPIPLGSECAGIVSAVGEGVNTFKPGDAVLGIAPHTFGKYALTDARLLARKPENISFVEAATLPITYLTAYYAMVYLGRLRKGERILIHAGAGGVGQAAIRIAQMIGAEVFTTAGSEEKHTFLRQMGVTHLMSSRSLEFARQVMEETANEGVDMVLNSLAGEFIPRSIALLRPYGRFLEIGKTDLFQNSQIDMYPFRNNLSYHAIDLDMVSRDKPELISELLAELMGHFEKGALQPLPHTHFTAPEIIDAFRYMAQRKNIGKIVVSMKSEEAQERRVAPFIDVDGQYVITGGMGDLGMILAEWLISKGARHLVLLGRKAPGETVAARLSTWRDKGVSVETAAVDVADFRALRTLLIALHKTRPVKGIFHAAGVLSDSGVLNFERESFVKVLPPKIAGSFNLYKIAGDISPDFLVNFSSVAATIGNPGQANYAAANIFMDAVGQLAISENQNFTTINWGLWATGMAARNEAISIPGAGTIEPQHGLTILENALTQKLKHLIITPVSWPEFLAPFPEDRIPRLYLRFKDQRKAARGGGKDAITPEMLAPLSEEERMTMMVDYLKTKIAKVLSVPPSKLEEDKALNSLGLDSLMAIELKNSVETSLGTQLAIATLLKGPSIRDLAVNMLEQLLDEEFEEADVILEDESAFPVSHGQRAMWFQHQLSPASIYNQVYAVRIADKVDVELLRKSLNALSMRHAVLRTNFTTENGKPVQVIHETPLEILSEVDATHLDEEAFDKRFHAEIQKPFDLEKDPLTRITLFHKADGSQIFLYVAHHIISDMWSLAIFMYELNQIYSANGQNNLPPINFTYLDYARQMNRELAGKIGKRHLQFWKERLAEPLPILNLHTDKPRPAVQTYKGLTETAKVDSATRKKLEALAEQNGTTLYALLLSAFKVLLHKYTAQEDIIIGTATTGRTKPEFAPLLGYFVNPVALRSEVRDDKLFTDYLAEMRDIVLDALEHQDYPFNLLVEQLKPRRDPSRTPVFQLMFVYQKAYLLHESGMSGLAVAEEGGSMKLGDLTLESISIEDRVVPFDMTMLMAEVDDGLGASLQYNTDLFTTATARQLLDRFVFLLSDIAGHADKRIGDYTLVDSGEQRMLLQRLNHKQEEYATIEPVHRVFEALAAQHPEKEAVVLNDRVMTYGQLNARANQIARMLCDRGVGANHIVGLSLQRSPDMVAAILGILKSGAAYLPLDADYPAARIEYMARDAAVSIIIGDRESAARLNTTGMQLINLDNEDLNRFEESNPDCKLTIDHLVYVIYTSGSTGRPKGVMVSHRNLYNLARAQIKEFRISAETRLLQFASISFDAAASEIFTTLLSGATLVLIDKTTQASGIELVDYIARNNISVATLPPSVLRVLPVERLDSIKTLISAGEPLSPDLAAKWCAGRYMINAYGPTEGTVCASAYGFTEVEADATSIPIGTAIDNVRLYVLDASLRPVPAGVPGELFISGMGVARGYLNQPALTADRFLPDPFNDLPGSRMYRSGDLVMVNNDGQLIFLDRLDHQVKIRGFRIELGEIENQIKNNSQVKDALVMAFGSKDKKLAAWVVPADAESFDKNTLIFDLHKTLPDYMVPGVVMALDAFPLTANGKIDRNALPKPEAQRRPFVKAETEQEQQLADIWQEVLQVEAVGIHDNFFDLGGHSLSIVQVQNKIREQLEKEVNIVDLFRYPTINALAKFMAGGSNGKETIEKSQDRASKAKDAAARAAQMRARVQRRKS